MEITSASSASAAAIQPLGDTGPTPFSQNQAQFDELAAIFNDSSGKSSEADRVKAYDDIRAMSVGQKLNGIDAENRKTLDDIIGNSDIAQRIQQLQQGDVLAVTAAVARGGSPAQVKLAYFDSLSASDQQVFALNFNSTDQFGNKPYSSIDGYRDNLVANAMLEKYGQDLKSEGRDPATDPTMQDISRLVMSKPSSESWTTQLFKMLGGTGIKDKVDLTPEAKEIVAALPNSGAAGPQAPPYEVGSMASALI